MRSSFESGSMADSFLPGLVLVLLEVLDAPAQAFWWCSALDLFLLASGFFLLLGGGGKGRSNQHLLEMCAETLLQLNEGTWWCLRPDAGFFERSSPSTSNGEEEGHAGLGCGAKPDSDENSSERDCGRKWTLFGQLSSVGMERRGSAPLTPGGAGERICLLRFWNFQDSSPASLRARRFYFYVMVCPSRAQRRTVT